MNANDRPAILGGAPIRPQGPPAWPPAWPEVREALSRLALDGLWARYHGPHADALAQALADCHKVEFVELCASGTAAVELALRGLKVGPEDEVILAAYDFPGNFANALAVGARPVLVDIDPASAQLDPDQLLAAHSPRVKAVIASHLHGGVVPMTSVMKWAEGAGVAVIEDACQMPGAIVEGRMAGTWGHVGVLSFGGSKLLTAGRGGAVLTNDRLVAQRIRLHCERGNHAYPLSEMQAAVLLPQLGRLDADNCRRATAARLLGAQFANATCLRPFAGSRADTTPGYFKLGAWYDAAACGGLSRERFVEALRAEGIAFDVGFRALNCRQAASRYRAVGNLDHATALDEAVVVLHHPVLLEDDEVLAQVARALFRVQRAAIDGLLT